eukprot:2222754-Lingulodinium_polyedra.AAC.1
MVCARIQQIRQACVQAGMLPVVDNMLLQFNIVVPGFVAYVCVATVEPGQSAVGPCVCDAVWRSIGAAQ